MRARKKPVEIEFFIWTGDIEQTEDPIWVVEAIRNGLISFHNNGLECFMIIETLEGNHIASRGDYIIKGVKGELYPCKPDIFAMTYDIIE